MRHSGEAPCLNKSIPPNPLRSDAQIAVSNSLQLLNISHGKPLANTDFGQLVGVAHRNIMQGIAKQKTIDNLKSDIGSVRSIKKQRVLITLLMNIVSGSDKGIGANMIESVILPHSARWLKKDIVKTTIESTRTTLSLN
jgi:hypothetical protein